MIKAHDLNFDNGEYVFFNIDLFSRLVKFIYLYKGSYMSAPLVADIKDHT